MTSLILTGYIKLRLSCKGGSISVHKLAICRPTNNFVNGDLNVTEFVFVYLNLYKWPLYTKNLIERLCKTEQPETMTKRIHILRCI